MMNVKAVVENDVSESTLSVNSDPSSRLRASFESAKSTNDSPTTGPGTTKKRPKRVKPASRKKK